MTSKVRQQFRGIAYGQLYRPWTDNLPVKWVTNPWSGGLSAKSGPFNPIQSLLSIAKTASTCRVQGHHFGGAGGGHLPPD